MAHNPSINRTVESGVSLRAPHRFQRPVISALHLCAKGTKVAKRELNIVKELLFWSYANLAMAHTAVNRKQEKYASFNYMIRARLFKGLMEGSMNIRTIFDCDIRQLVLSPAKKSEVRR